MQQRVEIVKTLATDAKLLIFDEPTAVLAGSEVAELFDVLRKVRSENAAVVLIAHKLAEILAIADRITVLRHGKHVATTLRSETDARKLAGWMMGEKASPRTGAILSPKPGNLAPQPPNSGGQAVAIDSCVPSIPFVAKANIPQPINCKEESTLSYATAVRTESGYPQIDVPTGGKPEGLSAIEISVRGDRGEYAIREVSFEVREGEIFGIGGVDGNGQAELAEALVGLRPLASGRLSWNGGAFDPSVRPTTGYIPQDRRRHGLAATMSIEENLILDAVRERKYRRGPFLRRRALSELASDLIRRYDIRIPGPRFPASSLSGGNQQKIVVARALRGEPDWIVAVNPTRGLDLAATRFVREQLLAARRRGAAILLISTDLDELAAIADRTAILTAGKLSPIQLEGIAADELGLALGGVTVTSIASQDSPGAPR